MREITISVEQRMAFDNGQAEEAARGENGAERNGTVLFNMA